MSYNLSPYEALQAAVEILGSQQALADLCGKTQAAVWKWLQSSKRLPAEYVLPVEAKTGVSRHELRPDIYPRGLVDGVPYNPEEPLLDVFAPIVLCRDTELDAHGIDRVEDIGCRAGASR